ncbi:hypothetical protein MFIFM68171_02073 [Madurella fahalii]|uniref:GED domain-containing protein n=1 Tax=Madurella fahalii TaxID=1157608 RepID=A0ABQ0G277_9PEZI
MRTAQDLIDPQQIALFDALKELSRLKVTNGIEVPQLIVVGDQSSGKSSVLEAIGRFHFPVDDSLCTLFPTRLILRRSADERIKLWIEPAASRSDSDRHRLSHFQRTLSSPEDFPKEMKKVAIELGAISASPPRGSTDPQVGPRKFKDDILVVESSGPTLSHVDLIDLPGLWLTDSTEQDALSRQFVQSLVENYIRSKRSLVLLVISARANFHNQAGAKTIQRISETDPDLADRVVGVMTSPDQALSFKDSMSLLNGSVALTNLRHKWLVVKNQDQKERRNETLAHRDKREENFFRTDPDWKAVPKGQRGIASLKRVLRAAFFKHTQAYLPRLISEIEDKAATIDARLKSSGPARSTDAARRHYLYDIARKFENLTLQACLGTYQDVKCKEEHSVGEDCGVCKRFFAPFGDVSSEGHVHNLRANIRGLHRAFALAMRDFGKTMEVNDNAGDQDSKVQETEGQSAEDTNDAKRKTKGQTPQSGSSTQSRPLNDLLSCHARGNTGFYDGFVNIGPLRRRMRQIAERLSESVAEDMHTSRSAGGHELFEFVLDGAKKVALVQGGGILVHDIVREVLFRKVGEILANAFELGGLDSDGRARSTETTHGVTFGLVPGELRGASATRVIENVEMFYEVSMMSFVGYVNSLVVESGILNELSTAILTGSDINREDVAVIEKIAGEKASRARKRKQDECDLKVLETVLETLRGFSRRIEWYSD